MKVNVVGIGKEREMKSKKGNEFKAFNLFVTHEGNEVTGVVAEALFITDFNESVYKQAKCIPINTTANVYFDRGGYIESIVVEK